MSKTPVVMLTHGGGPMPLLNDPSQADITKSLQTKVASTLDKASPSAILLVTAHWEEPYTKVSAGPKPKLFYDYYNFPAEAYKFKYPAPGSPEVAQQVISLLRKHGLKAESDEERGWDHGVFVPMLLARPQADIPIVQMSVLSSQSPSELLALGSALQSLRSQNILIVGSGSAAFHSFRNIGRARNPDFNALQTSWRQKLDAALRLPRAADRAAALERWQSWEGSAEMHPVGKTEHFSPALVCAGAVGDLREDEGDSVVAWNDQMMGLTMTNWIFASA